MTDLARIAYGNAVKLKSRKDETALVGRRALQRLCVKRLNNPSGAGSPAAPNPPGLAGLLQTEDEIANCDLILHQRRAELRSEPYGQ